MKNKKNKLEFLSENSEFLNFIDILPINYTLFSLADDIIVAEYFNVKDIQNPILSFRGICQSMTFNFNRYYGCTSYPFSNDDIIDETVRFYRHLSDEEANNDRVSIITNYEFTFKDIKLLKEKLSSKFSNKVELLGTVKLKNKECALFKYKLKDSIHYRMVKKYQKGVFERLNWYKKKEQLNFPYLH